MNGRKRRMPPIHRRDPREVPQAGGQPDEAPLPPQWADRLKEPGPRQLMGTEKPDFITGRVPLRDPRQRQSPFALRDPASDYAQRAYGQSRADEGYEDRGDDKPEEEWQRDRRLARPYMDEVEGPPPPPNSDDHPRQIPRAIEAPAEKLQEEYPHYRQHQPLDPYRETPDHIQERKRQRYPM